MGWTHLLCAGNQPSGVPMVDWFVNTLRTYPEVAIFLSLGLGYYFGSFTYKGLGLRGNGERAGSGNLHS